MLMRRFDFTRAPDAPEGALLACLGLPSLRPMLPCQLPPRPPFGRTLDACAALPPMHACSCRRRQPKMCTVRGAHHRPHLPPPAATAAAVGMTTGATIHTTNGLWLTITPRQMQQERDAADAVAAAAAAAVAAGAAGPAFVAERELAMAFTDATAAVIPQLQQQQQQKPPQQ